MKSILSKHLGIKSEDTATSTLKKKFNDSALKKWAIVSPLVETKQLVRAVKIFTQIHSTDFL